MELSNIVVDFDAIETELEQKLLENSSTFKAIYPGETSRILTEILAGYAAMINYRIVTSLMNLYLDTAFSDTSIYSLSEMLGASLRGMTGASIDVVLHKLNLLDYSVPMSKHTAFEIQGLKYYTREDYSFPAGELNTSTLVTMYQGEVITKEFVTDGSMNERFEFGEDFKVDSNYVEVYVNDIKWKLDKETLLDYVVDTSASEDDVQVVLFRTIPTGGCYIEFGNGLYGALPPANSVVKVVYARCDGTKGNYSNINNTVKLVDTITYNDIVLQVEARSTSASAGGTDKISTDALKFLSPRMYAANNRAVRRQDYIALFMYYRGYTDIKVWGEYEESEKRGYADNSMMNRVFYSGLIQVYSPVTLNYGKGDGSTKGFDNMIGSVNAIPGSISVKDTNSGVIYRDYGGNNYMFSNNQTINSISEVSTLSASSSAEGYPISNVSGSDLSKYWASAAVPKLGIPVRINMSFNSANDLAGIRIMAANETNIDSRAFPKTVVVFGTTSDNPNFSTPSADMFIDGRTEWKLLTAYVNLQDPGVNAWSDWISLNTNYSASTSTYKHYQFCIFNRYGTAATVKINKIQLIKRSDASYVDYDTGRAVVTFETAPADGAIIQSTYTGETVNDSQLIKDKAFIKKYNHFTTYIQYKKPVAVSLDIKGTVIYSRDADLAALKNNVETAVRNMFTIVPGYIGSGFKLSKLYHAIMSIDGVKYCNIMSPTANKDIELYEFIMLSDLNLEYETISLLESND